MFYSYKNVSNNENLQKAIRYRGAGMFYSIGKFFARVFLSKAAKRFMR